MKTNKRTKRVCIGTHEISEAQLQEFNQGIDYDQLCAEAFVSILPKKARSGVAKKLSQQLNRKIKVWL